jgi:hypothetical protein
MLAYWYTLHTGYWYALDTHTSTLYKMRMSLSSRTLAYWYAVGNNMNSDMLASQYAQ